MNRLEELMLWQRQQQEKLQFYQQEQKELLSQEQKRLYQVFGLRPLALNPVLEESVTEQSADSGMGFSDPHAKDMEDIEDTRDNKKGNTSVDDIPIKTPVKDFYQLLQQKLELDKPVNHSSNLPEKPKRKFLRKGEGLARFRLKPDRLKPKVKERSVKSAASNNLPQIVKPGPLKLVKSTSLPPVGRSEPQRPIALNSDKLEAKETLDVRPISAPVQSVVKKTLDARPTSAPAQSVVKKTLDARPTSAPAQSVTNDYKVSKILPTWASVFKSVNSSCDSPDFEKKTKELDELRMFELLEQHAANSSFCSTSSLVVRLLEDSIKSTPKSASPNKEPRLWTKNAVSKRQLTFHIGNGEAYSQSDSDTSGFEPFMDKQVDIACTTQQSSTVFPQTVFAETERMPLDSGKSHVRFASNIERNSPVIAKNKSGSADMPCVSTKEQTEQEEENVHFDDSQDEQDWSDACSCSSCNASHSESESPAQQISPSPEKKAEEPSTNPVVTDANVQTSPANSYIFKSSLLEDRLHELEKEIGIFQKENANLLRMKKLHEEEVVKFKKEQKELERKLNEDKEKMFEMVQEERKKLSRERHVFERYVKRTRDQPSRKEREEIQNLKDQIASLQEELVKKDSRWSATQVRTHNRIQNLEKQIRELKDENDKLKQERDALKKVRFANSRPKAASNTKAMHVINEQLGSLKIDETLAMATKKNPQVEHDHQKVVQQQSHLVSNVQPETSAQETEKKQQIQSEERPSHKVGFHNLASRSSFSKLKNMFQLSVVEEEDEKAVDNTFHETDDLSDKRVYNAFCSTVQEMEGGDQDEDLCNINTKQGNTHIGEERGENQVMQQVLSQTNKGSFIETVKADGTREKAFEDGRQEIWFPNGNVKKISADNTMTKVIYFNGDVKETCSVDGKEKYYYAETKTWHTTYPDGMEVLDFPDGQTERRFPDGGKEIAYPNGCLQVIFPEGNEEWTLADGVVVRIHNDEKILKFPNGQCEIHTKDHKRREYPDGTVKFLYPDGRQETRYANGRIRMKDKDGRVLMDSGVR
ncbi:centromere protein J isoform X2 [Anabrus simplex]|uniref:centromere protein J isoform X2 n=1 Tax=Anabrus simplex TaxID=316456 RepID=UPI0035A368F0